MSREYHYFIASLPMLQFDAKPSMSVETFLLECQRLLSDEDFSSVKDAIGNESGQKSKNFLLNLWRSFEKNFSNELVYFRASRLHKDPLDYVKGERAFEPHIVEIIQQAAKMPDLFMAEKMMDKARWMFLDELLIGHYFDVEVVIIYALKLRILERYEEFTSGKGQEQYQQIKQISLPETIRA